MENILLTYFQHLASHWILGCNLANIVLAILKIFVFFKLFAKGVFEYRLKVNTPQPATTLHHSGTHMPPDTHTHIPPPIQTYTPCTHINTYMYTCT